MESLPIDIHCSKLLDWLISRRHCTKDWQQEAYKIRAKINHAIQDMPEHTEIVQLLSGTYINYFHCLRIVQILKETEADSRNIFGFYSSQRMKDWNEIVKLYEKDNIFLAEAAQILQRLVQYEVPGVKKQIAKCHSSQEECDKKEAEYVKLSKESERQFLQECGKFEISPVVASGGAGKIRGELLRLAENLPEFFQGLAKKTLELGDCMNYYIRFRQHLLRSTAPETSLLPVLRYLHHKGNTTYFEWKTGRKPDQMESLSLRVAEEISEDSIDFGVDIDFGEIEAVDSIAEIAVVSDSQSKDSFVPSEADNVARGLEAFSILEHSQTQQLFTQDLLELEAFLEFRLRDLNWEHPSDFLLGSQGSRDSVGGPEVTAAAMKGENEIKGYLGEVRDLIKDLVDPNRKHLFKIGSSPQYLERLTEELEQKRCQSGKYARLGEIMREKREELGKEAAELKPKLDLLVRRTKELQKQVEVDISKRYKGRVVNIMGSISTVV